MILGYINIKQYLQAVGGLVTGDVITDAKDRQYRQTYRWEDQGNDIVVQRADGNGDAVVMPSVIALDEGLIAFFGLYSGDGAKGGEDRNDSRRIIPQLSFSQKEKHLVRFAVDQFKKLFPGSIRFNFSLGEDSAYFMAGIGEQRLADYYTENGRTAQLVVPALGKVRPSPDAQDLKYLQEVRPDVPGLNEDYLAFHYHHKEAMQYLLTEEKKAELSSVGIEVNPGTIGVTASLRRPFKKGARAAGGSSRSDEIHLGGLNGLGELFLKMMHEIEDSILLDTQVSGSGLIEWVGQPSRVGETVDVYDFFTNNPYGKINKVRPKQLGIIGSEVVGKWPGCGTAKLKRTLIIDPLWCYIAGLYLAEGSTPKEVLFKMFGERPEKLSLGFTSSEGISLELMLRVLQKLFRKEDCLDGWKVKVGSQYFPELVVTGLKQGVAMLRGGRSGDGKLRTMEISLAIKDWALEVADQPLQEADSLLRTDYANRYSHVEPTGAGVARIDFWASSTLCRWYFPLLMHTVFGSIVTDPLNDFYE